MSWVEVGSYPPNSEELAREKKKWEDVAEDMALYPEVNVRLTEAGGVVRIEVSDDLYSCIRGF